MLPAGCDCTQRTTSTVNTQLQTQTATQPEQTTNSGSVFQAGVTPYGYGGGFMNNLLGSIFSIAEGAAGVLAQNAPMICQMYMMDKYMNNNNNCCHSYTSCAPQRPIVVRSYRNYPMVRHFSRPMHGSFCWRPRTFTFSNPNLYRPSSFGGNCFKPRPFGKNIC